MTPIELEQEHYKAYLRENTNTTTIQLTPEDEVFLVVNSLITQKVHPTNKHIAEDLIYDIPIILNGQEIGILCLMTQIPSEPETLASLTDAQYAAYISMIDATALSSGAWPSFPYDCVVIQEQHFASYKRNLKSSPLWGGFIHLGESQEIANQKIGSKSLEIEIHENCVARTTRHQDCLELAARAAHSTERFLHLYHYLELDYDYEVVKGIKAINENDPQKLWDILKLSREDIDRIQHILREYDNLPKLESLLTTLRYHENAAIRIFYDYGKDSNPLKDATAFREQFILSACINRTELDNIKKAKSLSDNFCATEDSYQTKIIKLVCYWIYRFRCSIAHNKLGEYYLNQSDDMHFLVDFAEPLLVEMVRFRMSKP
ncbi:hypothetical protein [Pseudomonas veronii]|uniref:hypothetical protein n=1 Tax=Pseudomonas veronii TaxID=76761 RepID=UPI0015A36D3C|nr:hypothetical protein [Pseudomonas veronii]NWC58872.1 hypothetical protein [Pseudomonas veronii]